MRKTIHWGLLSKTLAAVLFSGIPTFLTGQSMTRYVNPLIGTDIHVVESKGAMSRQDKGQTMPAVGVPHGNTNWVAQTQSSEQKCMPPYVYYKKRFQGFRASHWMNGSCTQDYGSVTIMPLSGQLKINADERGSAFSHDREKASPYYYSVFLDESNILAEMTGVSHSGLMRFTFEKPDDRYLVIEPNSDEGEGFIEIHPETNEIVGYNPAHRIYQGRGKYAGFNGWFVIKADQPFEEFGTWNGSVKNPGIKTSTGKKTGVGAYVKLSANGDRAVNVRVGMSFTSLEEAHKNLNAEIDSKTFEDIQALSRKAWENSLQKITVSSVSDQLKTKFYTALYFSMFLPREFSDVDGSYIAFDSNNKVMKADGFTYYCDFSLWDTYRSVHPLLTIIDQKSEADMVHSFVVKGEEGGWLPIFPAWNNYTSEMVGDHGLSLIGDAIVKNIKGFDYNEAYRIMRKNAFEVNTDYETYKDGKGRRALQSYLKYNYIPLEDTVKEAFHQREQVSRTLEYAYDDFALAQVAKKLGKKDDYDQLFKRAQNYKNVIDPETGFARGRFADGSWIRPFDPYTFGDISQGKGSYFITEGIPFHYTWYVPHDVAGLMKHMGGRERFINRLDTFFNESYYWHGNEPCHHIAYLFNYAGQPWKTQKWVHNIIQTQYNTTPDGLCGNDDAGQMSAWLVFSMTGFYPVCPGLPYYVIGSPAFERTDIKLENGKTFTVLAKNVSDKNIYIQSAKLNGKPYDKSYILHDDIMKGGIIEFTMGIEPNKQWASKPESIPFSMK